MSKKQNFILKVVSAAAHVAIPMPKKCGDFIVDLTQIVAAGPAIIWHIFEYGLKQIAGDAGAGAADTEKNLAQGGGRARRAGMTIAEWIPFAVEQRFAGLYAGVVPQGGGGAKSPKSSDAGSAALKVIVNTGLSLGISESTSRSIIAEMWEAMKEAGTTRFDSEEAHECIAATVGDAFAIEKRGDRANDEHRSYFAKRIQEDVAREVERMRNPEVSIDFDDMPD